IRRRYFRLKTPGAPSWRLPALRAIASFSNRKLRMDPAQIAVLSGLVIGLVYGSVGLLSGFCMMSSLRGWWAEGDSRLVRTYALAMGVGIAASQLLAARSAVDLGKSIYLQ